MTGSTGAASSGSEPLPEFARTLRAGIENDDAERVRNGLAMLFSAFPGLTPAKVGAKLNRSERAVQKWGKEGKGLKSQMLPPLVALYYELKEEFSSTVLEEVCYVKETLDVREPSWRIRIGIPPVWDSVLYTAFDELLFSMGVAADFGFLDSWSTDAFDSLEDGRYDALVHNRFLLSAAHQKDKFLSLCMTHPLNVYRGQFVFARREWLGTVLEQQHLERGIQTELRNILSDPAPYDLFQSRSIKFPALTAAALQAVLKDAAPAYMRHTDHEEVFRQLYAQAFDGDDWSQRKRDHECRDALTVSDLYDGFADTVNHRFDLFCGGIPFLWKFATEGAETAPQFLTICDPLRLRIASLNGIVVHRDTLDGRREELDRVALAFYTGIRLLQDWYRSLSEPVGPTAEPLGPPLNQHHLIHLITVCNEQSHLLGTKPLVNDITRQGELGPVRIAWAWARLMMRYIEFFQGGGQANRARSREDVRAYAESLQELIEP